VNEHACEGAITFTLALGATNRPACVHNCELFMTRVKYPVQHGNVPLSTVTIWVVFWRHLIWIGLQIFEYASEEIAGEHVYEGTITY